VLIEYVLQGTSGGSSNLPSINKTICSNDDLGMFRFQIIITPRLNMLLMKQCDQHNISLQGWQNKTCCKQETIRLANKTSCTQEITQLAIQNIWQTRIYTVGKTKHALNNKLHVDKTKYMANKKLHDWQTKGNNKITELQTIFQRESQNS